MPKVSAKRQITLPIDQCRIAGIEPGDDYQSFVDSEGHITIVKKVAGAAHGLLNRIKGNARMSDEASMKSGMGE
jgi:bifunctional DNA-binding transcriptional regulator/antitoxin component of YhaV-PrlF toxin-antitoxin module